MEDKTLETIDKVLELLQAREYKAWLMERTILQDIVKSRKTEKKQRKKDKAEQFGKNRIIV